jgi:hypothetical protein
MFLTSTFALVVLVLGGVVVLGLACSLVLDFFQSSRRKEEKRPLEGSALRRAQPRPRALAGGR